MVLAADAITGGIQEAQAAHHGQAEAHPGREVDFPAAGAHSAGEAPAEAGDHFLSEAKDLIDSSYMLQVACFTSEC